MDSDTMASADSGLAEAFGDSVRRWADEQYGRERRSSVLAGALGHDAEAWRDYARFGWLSLYLPEESGGLDGDPHAAAALMRVAGSHLLMEPLLTSAVLAACLLRPASGALASAEDASLLAAVCAGTAIVAVAHHEDGATHHCELRESRGGRLHGHSRAVLHAGQADHLIVSCVTGDGQAALALVEARDVLRTPLRLVDGRSAADCGFEDVPARLLGHTTEADPHAGLERLRDLAALALCAEAQGAVRALIVATRQYIGERVQFGSPIGSNQVLQHRMADMYLMECEIAALAAACVDACADRADRADPRADPRVESGATARARLRAAARVHVAHASRRIALDAVQLHGGMGMTEELPVSHWLRRILVNSVLFGSASDHLRALGQPATGAHPPRIH